MALGKMMTENLDALADAFHYFIDRNGKVVSKDSNQITKYVEMRLERDGMLFEFKIQQNVHGTGSHKTTIKRNGRPLLELVGNYTGRSSNTVANVMTEESEWDHYVLRG